MKQLYFLCSLIVLLLMSSCKSYRYIDIQVLNPGKIKISQDLNNLVVIDPRYLKARRDSVIANAKHKPYYELIINNFNSTLKKNLKQSPVFENVTVTFPDAGYKLSDSIMNYGKGKLLLKFYYRILIDTANAQNSMSDLGFFGNYVVYYKFQFEVSNVEDKVILDWYEFSKTFSQLRYSSFDNVNGAIIKACQQAAEEYAHRLAPFWTMEERMLYYSGNQLVRKGYKRFCENDLKGATDVWNQLYDTGTRRLASLAAHNIALVFEMQDDLDACENWLLKSIQSKLHKETKEYLEKIRKRKLARISLEQQIE